MRWLKWFPWRFILGWVARAHGFLDPVAVLARLRRFAQPSEINEPVELLRAGMIFHARGLINSRVIQHNLDWVWPYWIERQFDPADASFVPRAFSLTHVNLTHRNWTAVGAPGCEDLSIVDPRGLLTPFLDGWSIDSWLLTDDGRRLLPSRSRDRTDQRLEWTGDRLCVRTETRDGDLRISAVASVVRTDGGAVCVLEVSAAAPSDAWLVLALRPCNPEGISFIHSVSLLPGHLGWKIEGRPAVHFDRAPESHRISNYESGDAFLRLEVTDGKNDIQGECEVGMATAAAMFRLPSGAKQTFTARVPLGEAGERPAAPDASWQGALRGHSRLQCPDPKYCFLYEAALRTLVLHSPGEVYPGPYTYKRFWFRDAAFIIHGLLCAGLIERSERALDHFSEFQDRSGYFHSQEGEWDSNGEALWILHRFCEMTGRRPKREWLRPIERGGRWIVKKRLPDSGDVPHAGLLPPGFSAEHLGPNDYFYWDDFWGIAGLRAAARLLEESDEVAAGEFEEEAARFQVAVERSLESCAARLGRPAMPASPYRRLDAGAIGSLAGGYPLQILPPGDERLLGTAEFLLERCFFEGAFLQDMVHSGLNAYLTLHVAQVLMRAGDPRCLALAGAVADLASPTGQWPEAIHPRTGGGCMGDGQHVWAAAEWILMARNSFLREEGDTLVLGAGIPDSWLDSARPISFGPAPTSFGAVTVHLLGKSSGDAEVTWDAEWRHHPPKIVVRLPGCRPAHSPPGQNRLRVETAVS